LVPSAIDVFGSGIATAALTLCAASVYQMVRGGVIVVSAIISITFLKRK